MRTSDSGDPRYDEKLDQVRLTINIS